jgi:hypothetical protein
MAAKAAGTPRAIFSSGSGSSSRLPEDLVDHIATLERGPAGKGEIEGAADAVEVAADIGPGGVAKLLRAGVIERSQHGVGARDSLLFTHGPGQAKVENLGVAIGHDHDVRGLDVAMHQARLVGGVQAIEHLQEEPGRVADAQRSVPLAADHVEKAHAGNVFQHDEVDVSLGAHGQSPGHVGMIAALGKLHLAAETDQATRLLDGFPRRQHLDGDLAKGLLVDRQEHFPHAPFAQRTEDPAAAQEKTPGGAR